MTPPLSPSPHPPSVPSIKTPTFVASTGLAGRVQLSKAAYNCLSPDKRSACEVRRGVAMKGKGVIDTHLASFDPNGLGQRLWRNFRRFEKMTKVRASSNSMAFGVGGLAGG